jgi:hypothetical protein
MSLTHKTQSDHTHWKAEEVKVIGDKAVRFYDICVHQFRMGDVEDPDLWAGQNLYEWQQSPAGQWCMSNAVETPYWTRHMDVSTYGYLYKIMARFSEQNITYFNLKFK